MNITEHSLDDEPQKVCNTFILNFFGDCVGEDAKSITAFVIGLSSILFWLFAQAPQLILNYKNHNADSLSLFFLTQWLLGDVFNLIGAVMTHQLPTQIYTAYYFVIIDSLMVIQWLYYSLKFKWNDRKEQNKRGVTLLSCIAIIGMCTHQMQQYELNVNVDHISAVSNRVLLSTDEPDLNWWHIKSNIIGYVLGCVSATLYLASRVPQIIKNFRRRSTGGLSFTMFLLAVMGNLTYSLAVFLTSIDGEFLLEKLPWILGSIGTLVFDFTIFIQFFCFKNTNKNYIRERREEHRSQHPEHHHHYPTSETEPLLHVDIGEDDFEESGDDMPNHEPISPLIYPAAQKSNYYF